MGNLLYGDNMLDKKVVYFLVVAEAGSFSAAARKLLLSQSALSQQVSQLEEELNIKLFDRSGYKPVLTEKGQRFYQGCVSIKKQCEDLLDAVQGLSDNNLRVGFTGSFENKELVDLFHQFRSNHPSVDVSFKKNSFEGCVQDLLSNKVDVSFGIESSYRGYGGITYETLFDYEMCVICAYNHRFADKTEINIEELKTEDYIVLSHQYGNQFYREFMNAFKRDGFNPKIKKEVNSFDELVFNVSVGEGVAIVAENVVRGDEVKIIKLLNSHHYSSYVVAYHNILLSPITQKFIKETKQYFKGL